MTLKDKIIRDMKAAQKGGDKLKLNATRLLLCEIRYKEKELGKEAEDQEITEVLSSALKKKKRNNREIPNGCKE